MSTEDAEGTLGKENCPCQEDCVIVSKLEQFLEDAKQCVKITQEKNDHLQSKLAGSEDNGVLEDMLKAEKDEQILQSKLDALRLVEEAQNAKANENDS